ncbi:MULTISPECIES: hypothetical protein [Paenibacillus]|uniref:hypothetical protein n=1 Tax=Paenibacillus TaxID=44249 RepID=UPI00040CB6A5|nr:MULTISPECIES: hypothetical protein [Paenibacillus]KGP78666.1 hypothetical protein P364_0127470 [Paenibacillus sp. MAEPY2]KGP86149.1 hypothetical protein P363_0118935 [Paenibacillus sp. MAEPY1]OZQ71050.1 hypothetical protein CA599_10965 [Paenibacillus taichungensis]
MTIISFWGIQHGLGVTSSTAAVAALIGMEYQVRTLVSQPQWADNTLQRIFQKTVQSQNPQGFQTSGGLDALERAVRAGKIDRDAVKNNSLILVPDRLDILKGTNKSDRIQFDDASEVINLIYKKATEYYDLVLLDLHSGGNSPVIQDALNQSDLNVVCLSQNINVLERFFLQRESMPRAIKEKPFILLISQYDEDSKFKIRNICNKFRYKGPVFSLPYNTSFKDHSNDGDLQGFFRRNQQLAMFHPNRFFIEEARKLAIHILNAAGVNTSIKQISGKGA